MVPSLIGVLLSAALDAITFFFFREQTYIHPARAQLPFYVGYKLFTLLDPKTPSEYLYEVYDDKVTETKLSPVNPTDPDVLTKYPLFAHAQPIQVLLEPGDILFIPALYWHQVNSYCRHISVNIWWDTHRLRDITEYVYFHKTADCVKRLHRRLPVCKWKRRKDNKSA